MTRTRPGTTKEASTNATAFNNVDPSIMVTPDLFEDTILGPTLAIALKLVAMASIILLNRDVYLEDWPISERASVCYTFGVTLFATLVPTMSFSEVKKLIIRGMHRHPVTTENQIITNIILDVTTFRGQIKVLAVTVALLVLGLITPAIVVRLGPRQAHRVLTPRFLFGNEMWLTGSQVQIQSQHRNFHTEVQQTWTLKAHATRQKTK